MHTISERIRLIWHQYWLLRWTISNLLSWYIALALAALCLYLFGILGALIGGLAIGLIVGTTQAYFFPHNIPPFPIKHWIIYSGLGGLFATLPVYLLGFLLFLNLNLALVLIGAVFAGILSFMQALILRNANEDRAILWVIACIIGGSLCAPLSLSAASIGLPLFFAPGPIVFGLISAWVLRDQKQKLDFENINKA